MKGREEKRRMKEKEGKKEIERTIIRLGVMNERGKENGEDRMREK